MKNKPFILAGALGLLSAVFVSAEKAVILESFEQSIDSVTLGDWGGSRIPDGVALKQYTKTGIDDINVTHGTNSLRVDLSLSEGLRSATVASRLWPPVPRERRW